MSETLKKRYKIRFEYLGDDFFGSQIQPEKRTVQGTIQEALRTLTKDNSILIIPSGRTDKGVSAKNQCAHFDCVEISDIAKFQYKLNHILPSDLKVLNLAEAQPDFHAQKQARFKHYRYTIQNNPVASVFLKNALWYPYFELDIQKINKILSYLLGLHEFSAFKSKSNNPYDDCEIYFAAAFKEKIDNHEFIFIDIIGNRFLYNMVRIITGDILTILKNNLDLDCLSKMLETKERLFEINVIQAKGLCLEYVGYENPHDYIEKLQTIHRKAKNENIQCKTS